MLDWQVWFHLNIAAGMLTAARGAGRGGPAAALGRRRDAVLLGVVLGVSVLINQETALLAGAIAGAVLIAAVATGWLAVRFAGTLAPRAAERGPPARRGSRAWPWRWLWWWPARS